ncbi:Cell division protein FtsZ 2-1, chloroplastic [Tetrabaena socialis]|uniref:Cell division protein FtsZ 2-1, chloroplastic n=1 Tax=Tetrabaena socialis TaxID=47790 RepID=A0A2J8A8Z1_9CHLO|nr:Cell division protein FtsZ 2-1, chloroplastic [Tetrabaena socialis]PNH09002.1 Cell division protein FtsZ 2-1, chloroplastic [Tetrabaena socialis]|eukprot:PNH00848.1 Cell division protein FtsZ 2-1, chloroplastic [Tetrabaena socialis]
MLLALHVLVPGLVNMDFADVRAMMAGADSSLMGQGYGSGGVVTRPWPSRAHEATLCTISFISAPLLEVGTDRATGVVWNIIGPPNMTFQEVRRSLGPAE